MGYFERVTPEEVGIASQGILDYLADIDRKGLEQHSLMVIRHGKCCAEGWWKPYGPDILHPLFSFSKTFTATAIGFAEQEGILSLDEKLVDIFPDKLPEHPSENLKEINLHHLLIMGCGHETENYSRGEDWIEQFLAHPVLHKPGTFYKYNTAGTNMLAAVLKRKTGQDVTEFLRPRLLDPLGIRELPCHKLADPDHVEMGGAGMKLYTEDMAKFTYFLLHKGNWEGKQLLREAWFDRASVKQIETEGDSEGHIKDWAQGYGYQCWMCSVPRSFRADGAFGQFGFVFPEQDMIVIMTSATEQTQEILDSMWAHLLPAVKEEKLESSENVEQLRQYMELLELAPMKGELRNAMMEEFLKDKVYKVQKNSPEETCSSLEYLIGGCGIFDLKDGEMTRMAFRCDGETVYWKVLEDGKELEIAAALDHKFRYSTADDVTYAASARWRALRVLEMEVRRVDALSGSRLIFRFGAQDLTIESDDTLVTPGGLGLHEKKILPFRMEQ